jgi:hypothetical protein
MHTRFRTQSRSPPHNADHHINQSGTDVRVTEQFLHRSDVVTIDQQVRRK